MKANHWEGSRLEEMRQRFRRCGIAVDDSWPEQDAGILILPDTALFACRTAVHYPGASRYNLRLRLLSDDTNRIISGYSVTSSWEEIRVLAPFEEISWEYGEWDTGEQILNNCVGRAFGRTRCREGVLLADGLRVPVIGERATSTLTVEVWDQFDRCYSADVAIAVTGLDNLRAESQKAQKVRKSVFEPEDPEEEGRFYGDAGRARVQPATVERPEASIGMPLNRAAQPAGFEEVILRANGERADRGGSCQL